jgi:hypothetical protein
MMQILVASKSYVIYFLFQYDFANVILLLESTAEHM